MRKKRVLLVDDERHLLDTLEFILKSADFEVDITADSEKAFETMRNEHFDAMVTGLRESAMDNTAMLKELRDLKKLMPVIIISSRSKHECCPDSEKDAIYIEKPFDAEELVKILKKAIKKITKETL